MRLASSAFVDGGTMPRQHTADGPELSPPLEWTEPPQGTRALALIVDDPDAPGGLFTHWLLWNLPPDVGALPQDVPRVRHLPDGSKQGRNDFGRLGWGGPAPPAGRPHRYVATLYALGAPLAIPAGCPRAAFDRAVAEHALDRATLTVLYGR